MDRLLTSTEIVTLSAGSYLNLFQQSPRFERRRRAKLFEHMSGQQNHIYMPGHKKCRRAYPLFATVVKNKSPGNDSSIAISQSRSEIADLVGMSRETVIRVLKLLSGNVDIDLIESKRVILKGKEGADSGNYS